MFSLVLFMKEFVCADVTAACGVFISECEVSDLQQRSHLDVPPPFILKTLGFSGGTEGNSVSLCDTNVLLKQKKRQIFCPDVYVLLVSKSHQL